MQRLRDSWRACVTLKKSLRELRLHDSRRRCKTQVGVAGRVLNASKIGDHQYLMRPDRKLIDCASLCDCLPVIWLWFNAWREYNLLKLSCYQEILKRAIWVNKYGDTCKLKMKTTLYDVFWRWRIREKLDKTTNLSKSNFSRNVYKKRLGFYAFSYVGCPLERR